MKNFEPCTFTLENFEGPIDFLWHLIQKNEIDIYAISLQKIMEQYLSKLKELAELNVDMGAEFVSTAASLLFLKSKMLLPKHEQEQGIDEEEIDPRFDIIHQLIDYCHFKQTAKELSEREKQQSGFYFRGVERADLQKNLGIEHLCLDDLASLFKQVLAKAAPHRGQLHEEVWKVSDKIHAIQILLRVQEKMPFGQLFSTEHSREELIVTFLAILELMKLGEIHVIKDLETNAVMIAKTI